jgi:glycerol uptake facilitator-like aquaporin
LAFAIRKDISVHMALLYIAMQIIGAICGAMLAHFMFEVPLVQMSQNVRSGSAQMGSEAVATFGLVMVILGGIRFRPDAVPWLVGLYITAAYWFTSSTSFANPAVTLARSLTDSFSGIRPVDAPGFIISQLVAAVMATYVLGWLFSNKVERSS